MLSDFAALLNGSVGYILPSMTKSLLGEFCYSIKKNIIWFLFGVFSWWRHVFASLTTLIWPWANIQWGIFLAQTFFGN